MEFLRFGSSIPGTYWGCCAVDIIQNFKFDPDEKASIQLVSGDGGGALTKNGKALFAGPTYRDIFHQRLRIGTFSNRDMPNHAFLAVLTKDQLEYGHGPKWLAILKECGFEFIRAMSNSVYAGASLGKLGKGQSVNYLFGLFRNIGNGAISDPFTPPKEWTDLPSVKPEAWEMVADPETLAIAQHSEDTAIWDKIGPATFLTEEEVVAAGAPVFLAGLRSEFPQQKKEEREQKKAQTATKTSGSTASPWGVKPAVYAEPPIEDVADYEDGDEEEDDYDECQSV